MACRKTAETDYGIYCWCCQVITVLTLVSIVIWLSLIPKNPSFTIENIYFSNNSVLNSSQILFDFQISNPNKGISIYYDDGIFLSLYSKGVVVGMNSTHPFYQAHKKKTSWELPIKVSSSAVVGRGFLQDFMVGVETRVRFRIFKWKTKVHQIGCEANLTSMKISPNGSLSGGNDIKLHQVLKL